MKAVFCLISILSLAKGSVIPSVRGSEGYPDTLSEISDIISGTISGVSSDVSGILSDPRTAQLTSFFTSASTSDTKEYVFNKLGLYVEARTFSMQSTGQTGSIVHLHWEVPTMLLPFTFGVTELRCNVLLFKPAIGNMDMKGTFKVVRNNQELRWNINFTRNNDLGSLTNTIEVHSMHNNNNKKIEKATFISASLKTDNKNKIHITSEVMGVSYDLK